MNDLKLVLALIVASFFTTGCGADKQNLAEVNEEVREGVDLYVDGGDLYPATGRFDGTASGAGHVAWRPPNGGWRIISVGGSQPTVERGCELRWSADRIRIPHGLDVYDVIDGGVLVPREILASTVGTDCFG